MPHVFASEPSALKMRIRKSALAEWQEKQHAVSADPVVTVAQGDRQPGQGGLLDTPVKHNEIVARTVHLGESHSQTTPLHRNDIGDDYRCKNDTTEKPEVETTPSLREPALAVYCDTGSEYTLTHTLIVWSTGSRQGPAPQRVAEGGMTP